MEQRLYQDLRKYHSLFTSKRCSGWELEELMVGAIKSDTQAQHHVRWKEAGHDDEADIFVRTNGSEHPVQVKSGEIKSDKLVLSGHRLGRFKGVLDKISNYLNEPAANIIAVPYRRVDGNRGRQHIYRLAYIDRALLTGLDGDGWQPRGQSHTQRNEHGVEFTLSPSMSWQIWWRIPVTSITLLTDEEIIE